MSCTKSDYETHLIDTFAPTNASKIYRYINSITGHNNIPITVNYNSCSTTTDQDKAFLFNSYFHSMFTQSSFTLPSMDELPLPNHCCSGIVVTEDEVLQAISSLNPLKVKGCDDEIGPKLLKHCAMALYKPLHHLYSLSISQGYVPVEWRTHLITPIHKSGDKSRVNNYRPISLLCVISKVLERLVYNHLLSFVSDALSSAQFGFRRKHSTLQQMLVFLNGIYASINLNSQTDVIYLDFKKAFDRVAHNELLYKLWTLV